MGRILSRLRRAARELVNCSRDVESRGSSGASRGVPAEAERGRTMRAESGVPRRRAEELGENLEIATFFAVPVVRSAVLFLGEESLSPIAGYPCRVKTRVEIPGPTDACVEGFGDFSRIPSVSCDAGYSLIARTNGVGSS